MITRTQSATFVVAICLVLGTITMVALPLARTSPAYAKPMKGKLLRRKDDVYRKPDPKERAALRGQDSEKQNKRVLKVREFKDMPVVLNEVRNLQSDTWYKDLEIEVKNVSSKPIYSILIYLDFPDVQVAAGVSGITMDFGLNKYIDISVMAEPGDLHLNPGDTYVFTIPEQYRKGLRWKQEHTPERMKKFGLHYAVISFGDGTGFAIDEPADYRLKRPNGSAEKNHHSNNRKNLGFIRAPPQDGCGTCGRYAFDSQLHRICWDRNNDQACMGRRAIPSANATCKLVAPHHSIVMGMGLRNVMKMTLCRRVLVRVTAQRHHRLQVHHQRLRPFKRRHQKAVRPLAPIPAPRSRLTNVPTQKLRSPIPVARSVITALEHAVS